MHSNKDWQQCNSEKFWREVAVCSHVVQIYESEDALLNLLEGFVTGGISANESVILIATKEHLHTLEWGLRLHGLNVDALCASNQYIPLVAADILSQFMVNDFPDYSLFVKTITAIFDRIRDSKRQVRAFGEMVAILWEQGNSAATMMLEHLWNAFFEKESFSLLCAYPKNQFSEDTANALSTICKAHSKIITNSGVSSTKLSYQEIN
ncbi:hypothetical protein OB13_00630 [Pontibacter sp. HJ8]